MWCFYIMDYDDGENVVNFLFLVLVVLVIVVIISGILLFVCCFLNFVFFGLNMLNVLNKGGYND